jgi:hypothetical protein
MTGFLPYNVIIPVMIIRICRKEASKILNINNTVKKVQWTFDSEAENLAERSAVTDSQHIGCVSE